jgi:hypothetical protein
MFICSSINFCKENGFRPDEALIVMETLGPVLHPSIFPSVYRSIWPRKHLGYDGLECHSSYLHP